MKFIDMVIVILAPILITLTVLDVLKYAEVRDSCHSGDFFKLRGKVYKCVWVGSSEFINGGIK